MRWLPFLAPCRSPQPDQPSWSPAASATQERQISVQRVSALMRESQPMQLPSDQSQMWIFSKYRVSDFWCTSDSLIVTVPKYIR